MILSIYPSICPSNFPSDLSSILSSVFSYVPLALSIHHSMNIIQCPFIILYVLLSVRPSFCLSVLFLPFICHSFHPAFRPATRPAFRPAFRPTFCPTFRLTYPSSVFPIFRSSWQSRPSVIWISVIYLLFIFLFVFHWSCDR